MFNYILKRILIFIPTLLLVTALVFTLSQFTTGDPVALQLETAADNTFSEELYRQKAIELGYDKPVFYFSITPAAYPDTLNKIIKKDERTTVENLIAEYGNAEPILNYYSGLKTLIFKLDKNTNKEDTSQAALVSCLNELKKLLYQSDVNQIEYYINNIKKELAQHIDYQENIDTVESHFNQIKHQATPYKMYTPSVRWHGSSNQYHHWLAKVLKGNLGNSFKTGYPVLDKLKRPLGITVILTLLALLFSYTLAIPIGLYLAAKKDAWQGKWLMRGLFFLFSMPNFWVATLAIVFLTTPQYGMKIFPSAGLADLSADASIGQWFSANIGRLILPVLCMIIHPVAEIARQIQGNTLEILKLDYIRAARAKGLSWRVIYWKHALKNIAFPLITMFGQLFAAGIAGSVIVEYIFNIHGIGLTLLEAIGQRDWNIVYGVLLIAATAVLIGHFITDVLYYLFNPKMINA